VQRWRAGEEDARDALIGQLHPDLVQIATARLRREANSSLSTGDLINEAVVRLIQTEGLGLTDKHHLVALASRLMRNILIDHARSKETDKRRHQRVELNTSVDGEQKIDLNSLDSALIRLGAIDKELVTLVEMRYFGGMTLADIGQVNGQSEATVKRRWFAARAWLADALSNPINHGL
jgi:RNA polymerase sigma factor (TIGR02999 family)